MFPFKHLQLPTSSAPSQSNTSNKHLILNEQSPFLHKISTADIYKMRFTTIIASGLFAASSVLGLAILPRELAEIESIANATAKGIDVFGPIPDDAVKTDAGYWTAEEGTDAWAWIRAQIDIPAHAHPESTKRQTFANIGIGMFAQDWCT